jgi:hypothetical protein
LPVFRPLDVIGRRDQLPLNFWRCALHRRSSPTTVRPDQTGKSCLLLTKGAQDTRTVEQDSYTGEIAVKRIR